MTTTAEWLESMRDISPPGPHSTRTAPTLAQLMATSTAKPYFVPKLERVEKKPRERHVSKVALVIHLIGVETPTSLAALCGSTKGRAWPGDPSDLCLIYDKWCSRCWNRWSRIHAEEV